MFNVKIYIFTDTFRFSRSSRATEVMYQKLLRVRNNGSILVTSPTQLKGILLSYVSTVHEIDETLVTRANGITIRDELTGEEINFDEKLLALRNGE